MGLSAVGRLERDHQLVTVLADAQPQTIEQIRAMPVLVTADGSIVSLRSVAGSSKGPRIAWFASLGRGALRSGSAWRAEFPVPVHRRSSSYRSLRRRHHADAPSGGHHRSHLQSSKPRQRVDEQRAEHDPAGNRTLRRGHCDLSEGSSGRPTRCACGPHHARNYLRGDASPSRRST